MNVGATDNRSISVRMTYYFSNNGILTGMLAVI